MDEIFHSGEREIQLRAGEEGIASRSSKLITDTVAEGAIYFIEKQPMVIVSSQDTNGQVWTSLIVGHPGFAKVPQYNMIFLDNTRIASPRDDIFFKNIKENPQIGSLFIELSSRRRFRINGMASQTESGIAVDIHETFPNCLKYIQRRIITAPEQPTKMIPGTTWGNGLTIAEKLWISDSDTFFVGSSSNTGRLDASHRGGNRGFVEILPDNTLKIPDYKGNSFYNTLGNFMHNPNAGLLFIDFEQGRTLQLTGKANVMFDQQSELDFMKTTGTGRYWLFKTEKWICTTNHHHITYEFVDSSPFNP